MTYEPSQPPADAVLLPNGRKPPFYGPDLRLDVVPGPAGGIWLRAMRRNPGDVWAPIGWTSRLSPNDLEAAGMWFQAAASGVELPGQRYLWLGSPAVAFGVIDWNPTKGLMAIDACFMLDPAAPWPTFQVGGIADATFDDRWYYMTVDCTVEACDRAAGDWLSWAENYGTTFVVHD
jgi:hypothetical protein